MREKKVAVIRCWICLLSILAVLSCKQQQKKNFYQRTYLVNVESESYSDINHLYEMDSLKKRASFFQSASLNKLNLKLNCKLNQIWLEKDNDAGNMAFQIIEPSLTLLNNGLMQDEIKLLEELTHTVFCKSNSNGKFVEVSTDTAISHTATLLQKEIISHLQFVSSGENKKEWETVEDNTMGTVTANYNVDKNNLPNSYTKAINKFVTTKQIEKGQQIDINSQSAIATDSMLRIKSMDLSEAIIIKFDQDTVSAIGSHFTLQMLTDSILTAAESSSLANLLRTTNYKYFAALCAPLSEERINNMAYRGTLGNDNWQTLNVKLSTLTTPDAEKEDSLIIQFRALAWLSNKDCIRIGKKLMDADANSINYRVLRKALSITETETATEQISKVIQQRIDEEVVLLDLLPVLATTKKPIAAAVTLLKKLAFEKSGIPLEIISTAQLVLGAMANNYQKKDSSVAEEITSYIFNSMQIKSDTIQYLLVLGNTGSATILPTLQNLLLAKVSDEVRLTAISSLRFIKTPEVDDMLSTFASSTQKAILNKAKEVQQFRTDIGL